MADEENQDLAIEEEVEEVGADVEMAAEGDDNAAGAGDLPFPEGDLGVEPRQTFISLLSSPIVTLLVGKEEPDTLLTAHQALLVQSPFFRDAVAQFADDGSPRQVELVGDDVDAVGCFLEYLYTDEYFPRKIPGQRALEADPALPTVDSDGQQLLQHARVYTIAEKFGLPKLKTLASSKIHCVNSTARGEIAYARYVYQFTRTDDTTIRAPVANFWAMRSHTLRSEAEEDFRNLCLEFPQFGYDILKIINPTSIVARVLDEKLKRERNEKLHPTSSGGPGRKRARHSNI